jgi:hypothetical protein
MLSWQIVSIVVPAVLAVYLLITDFVDLYPFNDVSKHTGQVRKWELLNYILPVVAAVYSWSGNVEAEIFAFIISSLYLAGNLYSWWVPYFFGRPKAQAAKLKKQFGRTIKILPPIKDHPIPNLEHLPVGIFILVWWIGNLNMLLK